MSTIYLSPNGVDDYRLDGPPAHLWVGTMNGLVRLSGGVEGPWQVTAEALKGLHVGALMCESEKGGMFAGTHEHGLYRSLDGGGTWAASMNGIEPLNIFTMTYRRLSDGHTDVFVGTEPAHLYRSSDLGDSWVELTALRDMPTRERWSFPAPPHIAHVKHLTFDPRDHRTLYLCVEQGALLKSLDDGQSFFELHFQDESYRQNRDTHRIVFHPEDADVLYLDGGDGISRSKDAGASWERLTTPEMRVGYPDQLFFSPDGDGTMFVCGGGTPPNIWRQTGNAVSAVAHSIDGGRNWTALAGGLPDMLPGNLEAMSMFRWPGGFGLVAGSSDGEIYASFDKGRHWRVIATIGAVSKCVHHRNLNIGRALVAQQSLAAQAR